MPLNLILSLLITQVPGMGADPEQQKAMLMRAMKQESEKAGQLYIDMFQKGADAGLLAELGSEFMSVGKPVQARLCFQKSLETEKSEAGEKGLAESTERLNYLDGRIQSFTEKLEREKNYQHACSKAAILFHMGYFEEAMKTLHQASSTFGLNQEINSLRLTFAKGEKLKDDLLREMAGEFSRAVDENNLELALERLGQLVFTSLGRLPYEPYMELLREKFGDRVSEQKMQSVLEFLTEDLT